MRGREGERERGEGGEGDGDGEEGEGEGRRGGREEVRRWEESGEGRRRRGGTLANRPIRVLFWTASIISSFALLYSCE
jgi:hypothetical protein